MPTDSASRSSSTSAPASRPRGRSGSTTSTARSRSPKAGSLDSRGPKPTTDPSVLYEPPLGSILPMGGTQAYKGFGLGPGPRHALRRPDSGGRTSYPGATAAKGNNVVFLALDPERFAGLEALTRESTGLARYVRATPRAEGVAAILLPGDPERLMLEFRSRGSRASRSNSPPSWPLGEARRGRHGAGRRRARPSDGIPGRAGAGDPSRSSRTRTAFVGPPEGGVPTIRSTTRSSSRLSKLGCEQGVVRPIADPHDSTISPDRRSE